MKARTWITLGAVVTASLVVAACGKGGAGRDGVDGSNAQGGAGSTSDQLEDLRAEIDELRDALESASEDQIPDLLAQLAAAEARLAELENCDNGGNCEGVSSALALTALTDAYCEWVFGCCTDDEVRATIGAAAGDEAGCKAMYSGLLARGNATPVMPSAPGGMTFDPASLSWAADGLQKGRIALNADNIEACAELTSAMACGDADPVAPAACGGGEASACGAMFLGLQGESEPCRSPVECEAGLVCTSSNVGLVEGVCLVQAVVDDPCQSEDDCTNTDGDLYCDEADGTCKVRPGEGDDCEFADPTFNFTSPTTMTIPCLPGYFCSAESSTCVAACEALENGDLCTSHDQCGAARYCDFAAEPDRAYAGNCATKLAQDATCSDCATECASGVGVGVCAGVGGDPCDVPGECASGSCTDASLCRAACDFASDCGADETCVSGVCYEDVTSNSACLVDEQCPAAQFCDGLNCTNKLADGGPTACSRHEQCRAGSVCAAIDGFCRPAVGSATGEVCSDWFHCSSERCDLDLGECLAAGTLLADGIACNMDGVAEGSINVDPCGPGLFCKRAAPNSTTNYAGTCSPQVQPGDACDRSLNPGVNQCVGNTTCATNGATGVFGCRVPYTVPDTHNRCVLNPQTFRFQTAYGNSGTGGPGAVF